MPGAAHVPKGQVGRLPSSAVGRRSDEAPGDRGVLGPGEVVAAMRAFRDALETHRGVLNRLNVYPVPDGDTGTNMALTLKAVVEALDAEGEADLASVSAVIARGALMGARGNSGVILCQILRGMSATFAPLEAVDAAALAEGLAAGARQAREAVLRPMEGTILTVASGAADGAAAAPEGGGGDDLPRLLERARAAAVDALHRTPALLPVLAEAGVVDAGGAGLVLLLDAFLHVADGRPLPGELDLPEEVRALVATGVGLGAPLRPAGPAGLGASAGMPVTALRYEVMYLLEADDAAIPAFREVWGGIGDSIVVVGGDGLWSCHVHTDDIGAAIEAALDVGRPREIRVTDLAEQVEEEQWVRQAAAGGPPEPAGAPEPTPRTSVVTVATGEGIRRIFSSLGVRDVVAGGQSMNPSTAEILGAVEATAGEEVVLLPNNANILPVAEQVVGLSTKPVVVVPTKGIQEGFAALLEYDPQCSSVENGQAMGAAADRVVAGEVTQAVRVAETPAGRAEPGDYLGLSRGGVEVVATTCAEAVTELVERLLEPEHEIVTLIEGAGASRADTRRVTEWLREKHPDVAVERHSGGQPLYSYLVSIE